MISNNSILSRKNQVQRFLWWCAGGIPDLLEKCSTDQNRYTTIGIIMLLVPLFAAFSFAAFLNQSFSLSALQAGIGGLLWALLIFNLDRMMLTHSRKGEGEFVRTIPRLVLAIAIGLLIGDFFLMAILDKDIKAELNASRLNRALQTNSQAQGSFQSQIQVLRGENEKLNKQLADLKKARDDAEQTYILEAEGTAGTRKAGKGNVYLEKLTVFNRAQVEYEEAKPDIANKIANNELALNSFDEQIKQIRDTDIAEQNNADGILARHKALFAVVTRDYGSALIYIPMFIVLMFLDSFASLIKLCSKKSQYDFLLEAEEHKGIQQAEFQEKLIDERSKAENKTIERIFTAIKENSIDELSEVEKFRAEKWQLEILHNADSEFSAQNPVSKQSESETKITIEVIGGPKLQTSFFLPHDAQLQTLEDLSRILDILTETVSTEHKQLEYVGATNSAGQRISIFYPLLPQLEPDNKLLLRFAPIPHNGNPAFVA